MSRFALYLLILFGLVWASWKLIQHVKAGFDRDFAAAEAAARKPPVPTSNEPIELVIPRGTDWFFMNWGIFIALLGIGLVFNPEVLWTRWLAWPAAVLLLVIGPIGVFAGWPSPDGKLTVTPAGIRLQLDGPAESIAWADMAPVQLVRPSRHRTGDARRNKLRFQRSNGQTIAALDVPGGPFDAAWTRLMDSLPHWSGREVAAIVE